MRRLPWMFAAGVAGAGAMYLLDPDRGVRRRAGLTDRARSSVHGVESLAGKAQRDVFNRTRGLVARTKGSPPRRNSHRSALSEGTPERRLLEGGGGAILALWGLARGGLIGAAAKLAGAALVARAAVWKQHDHIVRVQKTVTIEAPIDQVYAFWSRIENFPRFMQHVLDVRRLGPGRSHWRIAGPAGVRVEWDAEVTEHLPSRSIAWRSVPGSTVIHYGEVRFERIDANTTRVTVQMAYKPPGGALAHGVAAFLHGDPKSIMDADLRRVKTMLEHHN
jgi:uncharacterized membrane protein